jgi:hypothetical protein
MNNGSGSGRGDPDPDSDTDRNESTNVPISKLRIETKPKCFVVFLLQKQNVSIFSKNFGTKPTLFDVLQFFIIQKILDLKENVLVR